MSRPTEPPDHTGPTRTIDEALEDRDRKAEGSARVFSLVAAARTLGRDRQTLRNWIDRGAPVHSRVGTAINIDLRDVLLWREEEIRKTEAAKYARPAGGKDADGEVDPLGGMPLAPKDLLIMENIKLAKLKLGQQAEFLVPRSIPEARFERAMGLIRQALMAVPERLMRDMVGFDEDLVDEWRRKAVGYCRAALVEGQKALVDEAAEEDEKPDSEEEEGDDR